MARTMVCFHAHPDDEALLTAGTMAKAAAAGHRVVLVVATRGDVGEVAGDFLGDDEALYARRWAELMRSADILGVSRLEWLGYGDSGSGPARAPAPTGPAGQSGPVRFVDADIDEAAARLAAILRDESADVLTSYDPNGGYGHPDHVQVHRVGARAGELAGTPTVLEATIDRELMRTGVELAQSLGYEVPADFTPDQFDVWYTTTEAITHAVDVSAHLEQKKAAMEAHASQATADDPRSTRSLELFVNLPPDYFGLAFGTEWFVERAIPAPTSAAARADDVFASVPEVT
jgi:LmbE family N-acetylglucosaminyl deacetylase